MLPTIGGLRMSYAYRNELWGGKRREFLPSALSFFLRK